MKRLAETLIENRKKPRAIQEREEPKPDFESLFETKPAEAASDTA